ncbi:type II toxin-antitoxin system RelE/ParE family toxin [Salegentibacter maritimus]|uniref:Type II toxin-antitoxin system RelE/ParE family toxin n=1 Tax=Salegentibacter maritimus TaxID=2794347 RepID=A0ABS0TC50_9FLAO|nr:type II toxin-antitoxin system RelE/ParE family toxin [Salegentibacter maritimus]MBI6118562.1 type II toxin-antitoxin system RelE/ParE family toxin [Salegentibacter maritimus]
MSYKIIVKPLAEQDISETVKWFYSHATHLTELFLKEISKSMEILKENPKHYQKRYNSIRVCFTEKFPFGIYYTIENNIVFVHAVLHTKRDPKVGTDRA